MGHPGGDAKTCEHETVFKGESYPYQLFGSYLSDTFFFFRSDLLQA